MRKQNALFVTTFVVVLSFILAACGGAPTPKDPTPTPTKVTGRVEVPEGSVIGSVPSSRIFELSLFVATAKAAAAQGTVGLADANVQALLLPDRTPIGDPAKTDGDGYYTLTGLPRGTSVIIVATKETPAGTVRASTFVNSVQQTTEAHADPSTSLATEMLVSQLANEEIQEISPEQWNAVRQRAEKKIAELEPAAFETLLVVGGGALNDEIGQGVKEEYQDIAIPEEPEEPEEPTEPTEPEDPVEPEEPEEPDVDAALAQAKAMVKVLRNAGYGARETVELQLDKHRHSIETEVSPFFSQLSDAFNHFMVRLDDLALLAAYGEDGGLYREEFAFDEWWGYCYEHVSPQGYVCDEFDAYFQSRFTLVKRTAEPGVQLQGLNGLVYALHSEEEKMTYSASGEGVDHDLTMNGTLNTDQPTDIKLEGQFSEPDFDISVDGFLAAEGYNDLGEAGSLPEQVTFFGHVKSNLSLIDLDGTLTINYEGSGPTVGDLQSASWDLSGTMKFPTLELSGGFMLEVFPETGTYDGEQWVEPVLRKFEVSGRFSDGEGTVFDGSFLADADVTVESLHEAVENEYAPVTVSFGGLMEAPGSRTLDLDVELHWLSKHTFGGSIEYKQGESTLFGEVYADTSETPSIRLKLENEHGIELVLEQTDNAEAEGSIRKGDILLATVRTEFGAVMFEYIDDTSETL